MSDITFKMTVATNVGLVRSNNEDNFIVNQDLTHLDRWVAPKNNADEVVSLGENGCVMVVADGMGGMNAGEVASEIAVTYVKKAFSEVSDFSKIYDSNNKVDNVEKFLKKVIVEADAAIKKRVKEDPSTSGMGTTIVMVWILGKVAHVAWCGDSRAYLFNRSKAYLKRLSKDHSYVQELVDSGKLDPELAFDHPNSNIITRSLGDSPVKAQPDYMRIGLSAGDYIILCTDGLCGLVRDEQIMNVMMQEHETLKEYREALFNASFEEGAYDNVTIALFECRSVKEQELSGTLTPDESSAKKKQTKKKDEEKKSGSAGKKILTFVIVMLVLAGIVAAACHFGIITVDEQKNIHLNISSIESLIRPDAGEDAAVQEADATMQETELPVQESADTAAMNINKTDSIPQ